MKLNEAHISNFRIGLQNQELCHLRDMKQRVSTILDDKFDNNQDQDCHLYEELAEIEEMYQLKIDAIIKLKEGGKQ